MKEILVSVIVLLLAALVCGCGTWKQYDPAVLIDGEPALIASGRFGGQGHLSIKTESGVTTVEVVQFGVSDVLGGTIKGIVGMAAGVFGGNPAPPEITVNVSSGGDEHDDSGVKHVVTGQQRE